MVHTLKGCPACDDLKKPNNFAQFKDLVLKNDPQAKIEIYEHPGWGKMIRQEEYPKIGFIRWAPTIMVTTSDNMTDKGDPTKVRILGGRYDASSKTIIKTDNSPSISKGLPVLIKEVLDSAKTTQIIPPSVESPPRVVQQKQAPVFPQEKESSQSHGKVKCRFTLVSYK